MFQEENVIKFSNNKNASAAFPPLFVFFPHGMKAYMFFQMSGVTLIIKLRVCLQCNSCRNTASYH